MKSIKGVDIQGKKVIVRAAFDVPLRENEMGIREVADDERIRAFLPTLKYLVENKAKVIIISHQGRPDGQVVEKYSLDPVVLKLQELLGKIVVSCGDCLGESVHEAVGQMQDGDVLVLENLRFHRQEEENDEVFAKELASLADIYVNDAFAVSHRAHASIEAITHFLPSYAGFLLEKEIETLGGLMKDPEHPFVLIMGGAKAGDKIPVIESLKDKMDVVLFGGAIANTFLAGQGMDVGASMYEKEKVEECKRICSDLESAGKNVYLPTDLVVSTQTDGAGEITTVKVGDEFKPEWKALDIGVETVEEFKKVLETAKTVLWNGDLGMSEVSPFDNGTKMVAEYLADITDKGAKTVICGGDTTGTIRKLGLSEKMTYLSTGGGAALELLGGLELPGVKALG